MGAGLPDAIAVKSSISTSPTCGFVSRNFSLAQHLEQTLWANAFS